MNNLNIRDARGTDQAATQSVALAAYEQYAPTMKEAWKFYREDILSTLADVHPAEHIVAETEDGVVGTVLLYPAGMSFLAPDGTSVTFPLPEIRLLAVTPRARGQGIATALMQECVRRARQSGAPAVALHTTDMMQVAMQMYERMGFVRAPSSDFSVDGGFLIKGYRLDLDNAAK